MSLRLPPLPSLRLFEAAGRHLSFKLAAEELGITPSAVSHGILALERWLSVDLFARSPRGLSLTAAGGDFRPYVAEALSLIAAGTQRLPSGRADRRILITCAPTFASRFLLPILPRFRERYADIALSIDTSHRQLGFPADGIDLAIRMGPGPWPGHASARLLGESLVPVCSPSYLRSLAPDGGVADLSGATLIHLTSVAEDWGVWLEAAGFQGLDLTKGLRFDTIELTHAAAAAGLGVAIGRKPLVDADLEAGVLVMAAEPIVPAATSYWLIGSSAAEGRPDIAAFRRWLLRETAPLRESKRARKAESEAR